jgi:hypothetical protein
MSKTVRRPRSTPTVLDPRPLSLIPGSVARRIGAIPLKGDHKHLHLLCKELLTEEDTQRLHYLIPNCEFTFADPADFPELHK